MVLLLSTLAAAAALAGPPAGAAVSRRAALLAGSWSLAAGPGAAHALFESPTQATVQKLATVLPRVQSLIKEVAEVERQRAKLPPNNEDDAYVLRFSRSVLEPLAEPMVEAGAKLGGSAPDLSAAFGVHVAELDAACRAKAADRERKELEEVESSLSGFLELGKRCGPPRDRLRLVRLPPPRRATPTAAAAPHLHTPAALPRCPVRRASPAATRQAQIRHDVTR